MQSDVSSITSEGTWTKRFMLLLPLVFLWRLLFVSIVPFDLFPDETYYWDWSRVPELGYYSKPPMIAWIINASTSLFGSHDVGVRFPAVFLGTLTLLGLFLFARRMFDEQVAFWGVAALAATPENATLSIFMTTDTPLGLCWAFSLWTAWRALDEGKLRWWLATGLLTACGILSKQMMLLFPVLLALFLFFSRDDRRWLKKGHYYLYVVVSLSALLPMLWWNRKNSWITLHHTAHHFEPRSKGTFAFISRFAEFAGSQFLVISPVLFLLLLIISYCLLRRFSSIGRKEKFLLIFGTIPLVAFLLMSFRQRMNPNWPSVYYHAALILTAAWGTGAISCALAEKWRKWFRPALAVGVVMVVITYALPWGVMVAGVDGSKLDPTVRMRGWREMARGVEPVMNALPNRDRTFIIAVERQIVSELEFYLPGQPRNYRWPGNDGIIRSQYEIWPGPLDKLGWDALLIVKKGGKVPQELPEYFTEIIPLPGLVVPLGNKGKREYDLYLGKSLKGWPKRGGGSIAEKDE